MIAPHLYLVKFEPQDRSVVVSAGVNLLEAARRAGIELSARCGGQQECGECCIQVLEGQVSSPLEEEAEILTKAGISLGKRLACCTRVYGAVRITTQIDEVQPVDAHL